ncbi:MAG: hypothetical protein RLZZ127_651 [Planctomycetota bacterium]|jgi:hypothetical protein
MIIPGGVYDKIGNWYEQTAVILQCLRVLSDEADAVIWEPFDQAGVDFVVREKGQRIAVQAKTRDQSTWTPADLKPVLATARDRLAGDADRFRFLTNLRPLDLDRAIRDHHRITDDAEWLSIDTSFREKLVRVLAPGQPVEVGGIRIARGLLGRIEIRDDGQAGMQERITGYIHDLAHGRESELRTRLHELASDQRSLDQEWTAPRLLDVINATTVIIHQGPRSREATAAWIAERNAEFRRQAGISPWRMAPIPRPDLVAAVCDAVTADVGSRIILVHAGWGMGKSWLLANVLDALHERGVVALAVRADSADDPVHTAGGSPADRLARLAGDGVGCLIIDQVDQVASTNDQRSRLVQRWVLDAVRRGMRVVLGCRTVDALQDSRLHMVLHAAAREPVMIRIEPLEPAAVQEVLAAAGIPIADLGPDLRRLVGIPLMLGMVADLVARHGGWRAATTPWEVFKAWLGRLHQDQIHVLDALVERMERDGTSALDPGYLEAPAVVEGLIQDGILVRTGSQVRIVHQMIADGLLIRRWSDVPDADALLRHLGPRSRQGLAQARRFRLCLPILAGRGRGGADIIRDILFHPEVRPIVRRAGCMGLAEVVEVSPDLRSVAAAWCDDREHRSTLMREIAWGQGVWFDALEQVIDDCWNRYPDERHLLTELCASVSVQAGDAVVRHLRRWREQDPEVIRSCERILWHCPSQDSEHLFPLRLEMLRSGTGWPHVEWSAVMAKTPHRVMPLLAAMLERPASRDVAGRPQPDWGHGWPSPVPDSVLDLGWAVCGPVMAWWNRSTVDDLRMLDLSGDAIMGDSHARVVELLAQVAARHLGKALEWDAILVALPDPLRDQDGWLLLRIGHYLTTGEDAHLKQVAAQALHWWISDSRWARLTVGREANRKGCALSWDFLAAIAPHLTPEDRSWLERWLMAYREPWTVEDEARRNRLGEAGVPLPNDRGLTAYVLLPAIGRDWWSAAARVFHAGLEDKFGPHAAELLGPEPAMLGGMVAPVIPIEVCERWSNDQWITELRHAQTGDHPWRQGPNGRVLVHSLYTLLGQVRALAARLPRRLPALALAIADAEPPLLDPVYEQMLTICSSDEGVMRNAVTDPDLERIVMHPAYRERPACAVALGWAIARRPHHPWPDAIWERLERVAREPGRPDESPDQRWSDYRVTDSSCVALHACAALAERWPAQRSRGLDLGESFRTDPDPRRRASAVRLAIGAHAHDPHRALACILDLAADPRVAAEPDLRGLVRFMGLAGVDQGLKDRLRSLLTSMVDPGQPTEVQKTGGTYLLWLWDWGSMAPDAFQAAVAPSAAARTAAAEQVAVWLRKPDAPPWLRTYAIHLAEDGDPAVGDAVMGAFWGRQIGHLVADQSFMRDMIASAAAQRQPGRLIDALDEAGTTLPIRDLVFRSAERLRTQIPERPWERFHSAQKMSALLVRLHQEAAESGEMAVASRALDALDAILESGAVDRLTLLTCLTAESA